MTSIYLRRYMHLPALIYTLSHHSLTLLNPDSWDDTNDSHYLRLYRRKMGLRTVLAACFSQVEETYHHWKVFAEGPAGVCIRFRRAPLLKLAKAIPGVTGRKVDYLRLHEMETGKLAVNDLPFLKRYAYENEAEYRLVFESADDELETYDVLFPLSLIERVTLSPWMNYTLFKEVKKVLREIPGCSRLEILRSTLIGNEAWKVYGESAA